VSDELRYDAVEVGGDGLQRLNADGGDLIKVLRAANQQTQAPF
jgi:hypothetical protein